MLKHPVLHLPGYITVILRNPSSGLVGFLPPPRGGVSQVANAIADEIRQDTKYQGIVPIDTSADPFAILNNLVVGAAVSFRIELVINDGLGSISYFEPVFANASRVLSVLAKPGCPRAQPSVKQAGFFKYLTLE
jgi:hypothetical protein